MPIVQRLLSWGVNRPFQAGSVFVLLTIFFAFQLPRLEIDASVEGLMVEHDPARLYYERIKATFGSDNLTLVVVKADDVFTPPVVATIQRVSAALERLDGVTRVDSLTTVDDISADADGVNIRPLVERDAPPDAAAIERIRAAAFDNPIFVGHLVASDAKAAGIVVYTEHEPHDRGFNRRFSSRLDAVLADHATEGIVLYQIGGPVTKATVIEYTQRDQLTLIPLAALVLFLILLIAFRSPQGVVAPLATGLASVIWGAGLMAVFGIPINMITAAVPSMVLVIGFAEDVHFMTVYHHLLRQGRPKLRALAEAAEDTALPILVTTATTIVAFATLILSDITMLIQFGYAATLALTANFVATLIGMPVILRLWPTPRRLRASAFEERTPAALEESTAARAGDVILRHRVPIVAGFVLLTAASLAGAARVRVDTDFVSYLPAESPIRQRMRDAHASLAGASAFYVVVETGRENGATDPAVLRRIAELQAFLEQLPGIDKTVSIADYVGTLHAELSGDGGARTIPAAPELVSQYLLLMDRRQVERLIDLPATTANILVRHNLTGSSELSAALARLDRYIEERLRGVDVRYTGEAILTNRAADYMALNEVTSLTYTLAIIALIHSALFMSVKAGLLSLVPNMVPVAYTFGVMGLLDIPLSTGTAMVATIAIGIAVDDTVHNMITYSRQLNEHHDQRIAVLRTMAIQSRPIIYISLALAAGFSVLAFSRFVPTVQLALLSAFVMIVAMFAELVLTPILLSSTQLVTLWNMVLVKMNPELVRRAPLFAGLSQWEARKVVLLGMLRTVGAGEYAIRKGEQSRDLFMVVTGRLIVVDHEPDGTERTLSTVEPGDIFGEMAVVGGEEHMVSARAETASEVLRLDFGAFERLRRRFPYTAAKVFRNLARILSQRLQDTTTALLYLSYAAGAPSRMTK